MSKTSGAIVAKDQHGRVWTVKRGGVVSIAEGARLGTIGARVGAKTWDACLRVAEGRDGKRA
jgi:hypothetical protein